MYETSLDCILTGLEIIELDLQTYLGQKVKLHP